MKKGKVLLIGRPNVGKSTLVNSLIGKKVAITSPKAQTTRFPIEAVYRDEIGEITFVDTPGVFRKAHDNLSKAINRKTLEEFSHDFDVVVYVIDPSREKDFEEARVLGLFRTFDIPKIIFFNKADLGAKYASQYDYLKDEVAQDMWVMGSALKLRHLKSLLNAIYANLPESSEIDEQEDRSIPVSPILNIDAKTWIAELIREKVYLNTRQEVPYSTAVEVVEMRDGENNTKYISAKILTTESNYKKMIIGQGGKRIKAIGMAVRKELELASAAHYYIDLIVEVDKHWVERF